MKPLEVRWLSDLPWPQIWTAMSWEIACWVGQQTETAVVNVQWNEELLLKQVDAMIFVQTTRIFRTTLDEQLGSRWSWSVAPRSLDSPHQLLLSVDITNRRANS